MELIYVVLLALCTAVIQCKAEEASLIPGADEQFQTIPDVNSGLPSPPSLPEAEDQPPVASPPTIIPENQECPALTSLDLLFFLLNLQCPPSGDPHCLLDWPFDLKPPPNKFHCGRGPASDLNVTDWLPMVHLINASAFVNMAQRDRPQQAGASGGSGGSGEQGQAEGKGKDNPWCMIVNFYAPYCPFSARLAPYYNALPRVFPRLYVIAVDATDYSKLNSRYGITGTPTVILWHNGKAVARFDDSDYTLKGLSNFLQQWTDIEPARGVDVADEDLLGPLPSQPVVGRDYYLILSWLFILFCAGYYAARSAPAARLWEAIRTNFREANE